MTKKRNIATTVTPWGVEKLDMRRLRLTAATFAAREYHIYP